MKIQKILLMSLPAVLEEGDTYKELAPLPHMLYSRIKNGIALLLNDPAYFWSKLRYQLNL
jgi:hypothetical protein